MRKQADYDFQKVIDEYSRDAMSVPEVARANNISTQSVYDIVHRYNIPNKRGRNNRKNIFNYNYFDNIDSKDKAYFLGWLYSDGNNYPESGTIQLKIKRSDEEILKTFRKYISDENYPIVRVKRNIGEDQSVIVLTNKHTSEQLSSIGVVKRKTFLLTFPDERILPKEFHSHFIRGYFDGDGCISAYKGIKDKNFNYFFTISGNYNFLDECQNVLIKYLSFKKCKLIKNKSIFNMCYGGNNQIKSIYTWMYKDCGDLYLKRKRLKFEKLCIEK
jgi:hypothetical protein